MGPSLEKVLEARNQTKKIVHEVASQILPGMSEKDGHAIIENTLSKYGIKKKWHPTKFRVNQNTVKSFREISEPHITLEENDVFFIDIGPVIDGYEGDYGETFAIGNDNYHSFLVDSVLDIFNKTSQLWKEQGLSGEALYQECQKLAQERGLSLNKSMSGHYLSEFPHALISRESLINQQDEIQANAWVLEILVKDERRQRGAFFEDLLIKN